MLHEPECRFADRPDGGDDCNTCMYLRIMFDMTKQSAYWHVFDIVHSAQ